MVAPECCHEIYLFIYFISLVTFCVFYTNVIIDILPFARSHGKS